MSCARELNTIYERRLRQRCSAASITQRRWRKGSAAQTSHGSASPVNKGEDDAHGHQQLERQGQVDFPDEPWRLKREAQQRRRVKGLPPSSDPSFSPGSPLRTARSSKAPSSKPSEYSGGASAYC